MTISLLKMELNVSNLVWFGGIGASLIVAYGSLYVLHIIEKRQRFRFRYSSDSSTSSTENDDNRPPSPEQSSLNTDSDSSIEVILLYKQVPLFIFEKNDGFGEIQELTCTVIERFFPRTSNEDFTSKEVWNNQPMNKYLRRLHDIVKYCDIRIQGYSQNVKSASRMIDELIKSNQPLIQHKKIKIQTSQIPLIKGFKGRTIRSIAQRSGAKIFVDSDSNSSWCGSKTCVDIFGTVEQIKEAYWLIKDLLNWKQDSLDEHNENRKHSPTERIESSSSQLDNNDWLIFPKSEMTIELKKIDYETKFKFNDQTPKITPEIRDKDGNIVKFEDLEDNVEDIDEEHILNQYDEDLARNRPHAARRQRLALTKELSSLDSWIWRRKMTTVDLLHMTEELDERLSALDPLTPPIQVFVSYIKSPSDFFIQINESRRSIRLDRLHEEMNQYYESKNNQFVCKYREPIVKGDLVAIKLNNGKCYRGYVTNEHPDSCLDDKEKLIEVFYADIGFTEIHPAKRLFHLTYKFVELPFQAIQCSLTFKDNEEKTMDPQIIEEMSWTEKELDYFRDLTKEGLWEQNTSIRCLGLVNGEETETNEKEKEPKLETLQSYDNGTENQILESIEDNLDDQCDQNDKKNVIERTVTKSPKTKVFRQKRPKFLVEMFVQILKKSQMKLSKNGKFKQVNVSKQLLAMKNKTSSSKNSK